MQTDTIDSASVAAEDVAVAESLAATTAKRSSRLMVFDAILELEDADTPAVAADICAVTGLSMSIVYDAAKELKKRGKIYSDNGKYYVCGQYAETDAVSQTVLPHGGLKIEKGDVVLELNPREARALYSMGGAHIQQASVIVMDRKLDEQQSQIRRLQRQVQKMWDELQKVAPAAQMELLGEMA